MPHDDDNDDANLSGLWHGQYTYPNARPPTPFDATLLESEGSLSGSITEKSTLRPHVGRPLYAHVRGTHSGGTVSFQKTYETDDPRYVTLDYEGRVSADFTQITGTWKTPGWSGRFVMVRATRRATVAYRSVAESAL